MHDARTSRAKYKVEIRNILNISWRTNMQATVDAFIEQSHEKYYTTLPECLRILRENVVILVQTILGH